MIVVGITAVVALGVSGYLLRTVTSNNASGYQQDVINAEISYANQNGSYTSVSTNLTKLPNGVTLTTGAAATNGQVSIAVGSTTGRLGLASINSAGTCLFQWVDTLSNFPNTTLVSSTGTAPCIASGIAAVY